MADDNLGLWSCDRGLAVGDGSVSFEFDGEDELLLDIDDLFSILDEKPGIAQDNQEGPSTENSVQPDDSAPDCGKHDNIRLENGSQVTEGISSLDYGLYTLGSSHAGAVMPSCSSDYQGKAVQAGNYSPPVDSCSASLKDWFSLTHIGHGMEKIGASHSEIPSCSMSSGSTGRDGRLISDHGDNLVSHFSEVDTSIMSRQIGGRTDTKAEPEGTNQERPQINGLPESELGIQGATEHTFSSFLTDNNHQFSSLPLDTITTDSLIDGTTDMTQNFTFELLPNSFNVVNNMKSGIGGHPTNGLVVMEPRNDYFNVREHNFNSEDSDFVSPAIGTSSNGYDGHFVEKATAESFCYNWLGPSQENHVVYMKEELVNDLIASDSMIDSPVEEIDEFMSDLYHGAHGEDLVPVGSRQYLFGVSNAVDEKKYSTISFRGASLCQGIESKNSSKFLDGGGIMKSNVSRQHIANLVPSTPSNEDLQYVTDKIDDEEIQLKSRETNLSKVSPESIQSNSLDCRSWIDDDSDVYIVENNSQLVRPNHSLALQKPVYSSQNHAASQSALLSGGPRVRSNKEQLVFQAALQDLSQPKSEAVPPNGALAVSLLRHQRIALSWMVQKETSTVHCSGGILADDQGLGKTVSTIALILTERPSQARACQDDANLDGLEILNLDNDNDDVDEASEPIRGNPESDHAQVLPNGGIVKHPSLLKAKGRPAAGTLIVCPTSVMRQWAEELRNKVSMEAKLSILVYHGSNRTKDPFELSKYDIVLTTYAIVSMEVPRQPLVHKEDDEKENSKGNGSPLIASCSDRKRKFPPSSDKKRSKHKSSVECLSGPLAKVSWFRVVLDEAQSIKNHKTQVAGACWGLRAKRRWCLSGTPIQNAIDDLYSYFRFLRYDPYTAYNSFCSTIKNPISRNPSKGYQKLQAVLKTIMLRRTKGTLLDGEPIISLPPKIVELRKVDFTKEERDFYSRLECQSRDQFKEYAEAGTVKQNYVNLLLMLLRLRQACDHPLLVKGFDSKSMWKSSVEMAKKLPSEKQIFLLNCLQASLAICGICNDAPEDAVVSVCGHVFCKQCICEQLTGDVNHCPVTNCKVQVSLSSVFSKATLDSVVPKMHGTDGLVVCSAPGSTVEQCFDDLPYGSSKIKAALEVLQSLCRPRNLPLLSDSRQSSVIGNDGYPENSSPVPDSTIQNVESGVDDDSAKAVQEKAIVFSQWTKMLDLLEACLKKSSIQYRRLDGTMSVLARDKAVKDFNTLPEVTVMIMSLKAASLGLNMVAACHVLMLDLWWNPTTEDQAIDRAHRIGQTRPVTVVRLTVKDTVEDRILALQQKKRAMVASAFGEDEMGSRQSRLTVDDLRYLFMDT